MRGCVEEGILQAYIDNELPPATAERVAAHAADCPDCARALEEAAGEMAIFSRAIEPEMSLGVPSQRLRERIEAAISELNAPASVPVQKSGNGLAGWFASLAGLFKVTPQRAMGFASLVAVVALGALFLFIKSGKIETGERPNVEVAVIKETGNGPGPKPSPSPERGNDVGERPAGGAPQQEKQKPKKLVKPVYVPEPDQLPKGDLAAARPLPGEENYMKAIESLTAEIESSGSDALKPSLRAEFERNLAVVNQAIDSTRRSARRNPQDRDAAEFLYSSYQNKLELLQAVAEQARPTIATR